MKSHCSARPQTTALLVLPLPPGRGGGRTCLGPVDPTRLPLGQAFGLARSARRAGEGVESCLAALVQLAGLLKVPL